MEGVAVDHTLHQGVGGEGRGEEGRGDTHYTVKPLADSEGQLSAEV